MFESLRIEWDKKQTISQTTAVGCVRNPFNYMATPGIMFYPEMLVVL